MLYIVVQRTALVFRRSHQLNDEPILFIFNPIHVIIYSLLFVKKEIIYISYISQRTERSAVKLIRNEYII